MSEQLDQATMEQPAAEAAGFMNRIYEAAREHPVIAGALTTLAVMGSGDMIATNVASANEGAADGNNLVCGGVQSKAEALRLANGGADSCGHRDIGKAWAEVGITPEVIKTMHWGTVSSEDGLISEGRDHGPVPSADTPVNLGHGDTIFKRPLSVWGDTTYRALVGFTEDGQKVAILENCGNGEGHNAPKPHHPKPHHPKPEAPVSVVKVAKDSTGARIPTPTGEFRFFATCEDGQDRVKTTATYNHAIQRLIDECNVGSTVKVKELSPIANPGDWKFITPKVQTQTVRAKGNRFVFIDKEKGSTPGGSCNGDTTNNGVNNGNGGNAQGGNCSVNINCSAINSPGAEVCPPTIPTPPVIPEKLPPTITVEQKTPGFEGGDEGDVITICATADSHPATDGVTVTAVDNYTGVLTVKRQGQTNEYCAVDTFPNTPETDEDVTFTATDNVNGLTAHDDTGAFPVRQPQ